MGYSKVFFTILTPALAFLTPYKYENLEQPKLLTTTSVVTDSVPLIIPILVGLYAEENFTVLRVSLYWKEVGARKNFY